MLEGSEVMGCPVKEKTRTIELFVMLLKVYCCYIGCYMLFISNIAHFTKSL